MSNYAIQFESGGVVYNVKDPISYRAISSYGGASESAYITYNYSTKVITIPAGFVMYKGRAQARPNAQSIDLSDILLNEACTFWAKSDSTIIAKTWSYAPNSDEEEFLGYVFGKNIWINGFSGERILVVDGDGNRLATYNMVSGSFIGIELEIRKVVYYITNNTLTLPGGFKVYRGNTSSYTAETISLVSGTSAFKLWMKNDKTIYSTAWDSNSSNALDDDCIGFIYGTTVVINGIPEACISVVQSNAETLGIFYGDAYVGVNANQEVVCNLVNHTISIPAGFSVYRGIGAARSAVSIDISGFANSAGIVFMKNSRAIYARSWSSYTFDKPDDEIIGMFWDCNFWLNGVPQDRISIIKSTSDVYCFGDSITAGTGTTKAYHMYFHDYKRDAILYNYGVGSTGYVYETSDTVTVGGGVVGIGSSHKENGNNSIKKVMQSISETMSNIIIAAGTNDYGNSIAIDTFRTAVQDALDYALTKTSHIFVITPIKRDGWATTRNSQNLLLKDYADVIIEECESRGITYANGYDVSINPTNTNSKNAFAPDGLHPNAMGHERMSRTYWSKYLEAIHINIE